MNEQRLIDVEEKLAFTERHVEQLDAQIRELFDTIAALRRRLELFSEDTRRQIDALGETSEEEPPPPHWGRK
jgi:uncharacterized coiled-coil protein SlyX